MIMLRQRNQASLEAAIILRKTCYTATHTQATADLNSFFVSFPQLIVNDCILYCWR